MCTATSLNSQACAVIYAAAPRHDVASMVIIVAALALIGLGVIWAVRRLYRAIHKRSPAAATVTTWVVVSFILMMVHADLLRRMVHRMF